MWQNTARRWASSLKASVSTSWNVISYYALILFVETLKKYDVGVVGEDGTIGYYVGQTRYRTFVGVPAQGMRGPRQICRATAHLGDESRDVTQYVRELAGPNETFAEGLCPKNLGWGSLEVELRKGERKTFVDAQAIHIGS